MSEAAVYFRVRPLSQGTRDFMSRVFGDSEYQARAWRDRRTTPVRNIVRSFERRALVPGVRTKPEVIRRDHAIVSVIVCDQYVGQVAVELRPRPLR